MAQDDTIEPEGRIEARLGRTIDREAVAGLRQGIWARTAAVAAIAVWIGFTIPFPAAIYYLVIAALFVVSGLAHQAVNGRAPARSWPGYVFITLDVCLLATALIYPNPLQEDPIPRQMILRLGNFPYFYIILAGTMLSYSYRQVVWTGLVIAFAWGGAAFWIAGLPSSMVPSDFAAWQSMAPDMRLQLSQDPQFVDTTGILRDMLIILIVTGILASVVWRMRRLAFRQADTARQRANLARYFSPNMVDQLTGERDPLDTDKEQDAAVMFLDIRGFSAIAEQLPPRQTLNLLRNFHGRTSKEVFAHDGTLDKFIGDGLMATFGVPQKGPRDATNAIACALAMRETIAQWNEGRVRAGYPPIEIGIGIHYGAVMTGDIGSEERLEFAVIGDTVNVASRLEHLSRDLNTDIVLSDDVMAAAHEEFDPGDPIFDGFREAPEQPLRGRLTGMIVWIYNPEAADEDRQRRLMAQDLAPSAG